MKARWREQLLNFPTKELWNQGKSMTREHGYAIETEQIISRTKISEYR